MARPVGSVVKTEDIVEDEVKQWAKVNKQIREMIAYQLSQFEKKIKEEGMSTEGQLEIMSGLRELLATSTKVVGEGVKLLKEINKNPEETDVESAMKEMLK